LYTFREWGTDQAHLYVEDLSATLDELANNPHGVSCDHLRQGYRRSRFGRHAIYFRITDYGIAVIRVLHDRMDASRHL
jgi:toxin ParE1/3/4